MDKKITPLKALNLIASITNYDGGDNLKALGNSYKKEFAIIEKALKKYNQLQIDYDELNDIHDKLVAHKNKERDDVVKKLKTLKIIKEKKVNVNYLFSREVNDYIDYNVWSGAENITKEEYELLKEVLE